MASTPKSVTFETTVAASGNNTGIAVPDEVIEQLAAGRRPPVLVNVNGYEYRNTVAVTGGRHMIGISAAVRNVNAIRHFPVPNARNTHRPRCISQADRPALGRILVKCRLSTGGIGARELGADSRSGTHWPVMAGLVWAGKPSP